MQSIGLGCCWIGLGKLAFDGSEQVSVKPSDHSMEFIIYIILAKPKVHLIVN